MENDTSLYVNNTQIANGESYIYRGQIYSTSDRNKDNKSQRITAGWTAFAKHRDMFKGSLRYALKRLVYNSCVLQAMTYGADTWHSPPKQNKLAAVQRKMGRSMLNSTYQERKTNIWVREKIKVTCT